jgi:arginase family enzyme
LFWVGHEVALEITWVHNYLSQQARTHIGIVNFDAHFDLRPYTQTQVLVRECLDK